MHAQNEISAISKTSTTEQAILRPIYAGHDHRQFLDDFKLNIPVMTISFHLKPRKMLL